MDFYQGKILRVDLSAMTTSVEPLRMDWAELYVGGKGLLFRYLLGEVAPGLDPFSPDDPLMFFTGPFAGTGVSTCSRLVVGCKSPQTGTILGGDLPPDTLAGKAAGQVPLRFAAYALPATVEPALCRNAPPGRSTPQRCEPQAPPCTVHVREPGSWGMQEHHGAFTLDAAWRRNAEAQPLRRGGLQCTPLTTPWPA